MTQSEDFLRELSKDPKLLEKLQKRVELDEFRGKYNVERATPFKCPACSQYGMTGGSLWIHKDDKSLFTCRKCKLTFKIECQTLPTEELIYKMRQVIKGEEGAVLWFDKQRENSEHPR